MTSPRIVTVEGGFGVHSPMTLSCAMEVQEQGQTILASYADSGKEVACDLGAVTQADSAAIAIMLSWLRQAGQQGLRLRFDNPPSNIITLAGLYGVQTILPGVR